MLLSPRRSPSSRGTALRGGKGMGENGRRRRVEHTDEWEQIELLCAWPEQRDYELIRPLVLFGDPLAQRAEETGTSERTLYRRTSAFDLEGMESLFGLPRHPGERRLAHAVPLRPLP